MEATTKRNIVFLTLLSWCAFLLAVRFHRTGSLAFAFMVWNLFLAMIPLFAADALRRAHERRALMLTQLGWFMLWLLFLPNAPYILTDFVHLRTRDSVPLWYDIALLLSCAGTGLLLAYSSLVEVQAVIRERFSAVASWFVAVTALVLSGFGIYLGRFLRLNSWDVLANPMDLLAQIAVRAANPLAYPRTIFVTVIYGMILTLGYVALRVVFVGSVQEEQSED